MTTHVTGQAAAPTAAPTLSAHRRNLLDLLAGAAVITTAEYDTAVQRILACASLPTLQKWYRNCIREIARREEAAGQPTPPALPAWLTTQGRITRAQRQELERRLLPQQATSHSARYLLESMSQWTAARATAELLRLGVCSVSNEVKRDLRFSVGGVMPAGELPRRAYLAFQRLRRVVSPLCKDWQFAQPGEGFDYLLGKN